MIDSMNSIERNYSMMQKLNDVEILKKIVNGNENIEELEENTKERLILLCKEQTEAVEKNIKVIEEEIKKIEALLNQGV